jgi:hypothetical protein
VIKQLDWQQFTSWMHRVHLAAIVGQLIYFAWLPLCVVALAVAGPLVGSMALFATLLALQYPLFRLLVGPRDMGYSTTSGEA